MKKNITTRTIAFLTTRGFALFPLRVALAATMFIWTCMSHLAIAQFAGGDGSKANPYQIATPAQLDSIRHDGSDNFLEYYYVLTTDLDFSGYDYGTEAGWRPIGNSSNRFTGTFNGKGHVISNLRVNRPTQNHVGLFGHIDATIRNTPIRIDSLGVENVEIIGGVSVGGLVGSVIGGSSTRVNIRTCYVTGRITGRTSIGGLVGYIRGIAGEISRSYASAQVAGNESVGGLVGSIEVGTDIIESYAAGQVTGNEEIGGLVGFTISSIIEDSYSASEVRGNSSVGGLIGESQFDPGTGGNRQGIKRCYAFGEVMGNSNVGGFIGRNSGGISRFSNNYWLKALTEQESSAGQADGKIEGIEGFHMVWDATSYGGFNFNARGPWIPPSEATTGPGRHFPLLRRVGKNAQSLDIVYAPVLSIGDAIAYDAISGYRSVQPFSVSSSTIPGEGGAPAINVVITSSDETVATIDGSNVLSAVASGTVYIHFSRDGNEHYAPIRVSRKVVVHPFASGAGWEGHPYRVGTPEELDFIRDYRDYGAGGEINDMNLLDNHYRLTTNLDFSSYTYADPEGWLPIGHDTNNNNNTYQGTRFTGDFDGDGYIISHLNANRPTEDYVGLFGYMSHSSEGTNRIYSLGLESVNIVGRRYVGGMVGFVGNDTLQNVYVEGRVEGKGNNSNNSDVGGIAGRLQNASSLLVNSYALVEVVGKMRVGGLVGNNGGGVIDTCYVSGEVTGINQAGSLVGLNDGTVSGSYWNTDNSGAATSSVGTGLTTAQMYVESRFSGWDFTNIWQSPEDGVHFPLLRDLHGQQYVSIAPSSARVSEGDPAVFALSRGGIIMPGVGPLEAPVSATDDGDYITGAVPTSVLFDGERPLTVTYTVNTEDDDVDERDGGVTATVGDGTGYRVAAPGEATVTIEDDDLPVVTIVADETSVAEDAAAPFTLTRVGVLDQSLTVDLTITQTGDFTTETTGTATFAADANTAAFSLTLTDDAIDEADGSVTATVAPSALIYRVGNPAAATMAVTDDDLPLVTIVSDGAVTEGSNASFTLTRAGVLTAALTVNVTVTQGNGDDVTTDTGSKTVTFGASASTATLTVATTADEVDEADGSVTATLTTDGSAYRVGNPGEATVTVEDDDLPIVTIAADATSVGEDAAATFTLTRVGVLTQALTVDLTITQTGDFTAETTGTAIFAADANTAAFSLTLTDDAIDEAAGSVTATVAPSALIYRVGDPAAATVAVTDDDLPLVTIASDGSVTEGSDASFTLTRVGVLTAALTVNVDVTQGNGDDVTTGTGAKTVTFGASSSTAALAVATTADEVDEADGSVTATLTTDGSAYGVGDPGEATVTVEDDDLPVVTIAADATSVAEDAAATFTLTRVGVLAQALTVNLTVTQTGDFTAETTGTATFAVDANTAAFSLTLTDDAIDEAEGSVTVALASSADYAVGTSPSATVAVTDNDLPLVTIASDGAVTEGSDASFTLTRVGVLTQALTVNVDVTQGSGDDVTTGTGSETVEFAASSSTVTLTVATTADEVDEADGSVIATLTTDGSAYRVGNPGEATVTVEDDDLPVVTIVANVASVTEGTAVFFTLTRVGVLAESLMVDVAITQTGDVTSETGTATVTFDPSMSEATLQVTTVGDDLDELDGSVIVTVTATDGSAYSVGDPGEAAIAVEDNDLPTITIAATPSSITEADGSAIFTLTRAGVLALPLKVNVRVTPTGDFTTETGDKDVTFAADEATATLTLAVVDDDMNELNGLITVEIIAGSTYQLGDPAEVDLSVADDDGPPDPEITIAASTSSIVEGMSVTFTLTRSGTPTGEKVVNVSIVKTGNFIKGVFPATVTLADGEATASVDLETEDDDVAEAAGRFVVTVEVGAGYTVGAVSEATVEVTDNDLPEVRIEADEVSVMEGEDAVFTLTRVGSTADALMVNVEVTQDGDVTTETGTKTVTFEANSPTAMLAVATTDDDVNEVDGSVIATVTADGSHYTIVDPSTATIAVEDDDLLMVTIAATPSSVTEADGSATFTLTRVGVLTQSLTVDVTITQTGDFTTETGDRTVTFAADEATATFTVSLVDDDVDELSGLITAEIIADDAYVLGMPSMATLSVADDDGKEDPEITIATSTSSIVEGMMATFTLTRAGDLSGELLVGVSVMETGDVIEGDPLESVTFADGSAMVTLTVNTEDDDIVESTSRLVAAVKVGVGYTIGAAGEATVEVTDNDLPMVGITEASDAATEGDDVVFTLMRTATFGVLSVGVEITQEGDYTNSVGVQMVDFADESATAMLTVSTQDDNLDESNGSVTATLQAGMGYEVGMDNAKTVSVSDDDLPTVTIAATATEVAEGTDAVFTLTREGVLTEVLSVNMTVTQDGDVTTAVGSAMVEFSANSATVEFTVATEDDDVEEEDGGVTVTVEPEGTSYAVGAASAVTVAVTDNDDPTLVGLSDEEGGVMVYPNPVGELLHVRFPEALSYRSIAIYTLLGERQRLYRVESGQRVASLDISSLVSGVYVIQLMDTRGDITYLRMMKE